MKKLLLMTLGILLIGGALAVLLNRRREDRKVWGE